MLIHVDYNDKIIDDNAELNLTKIQKQMLLKHLTDLIRVILNKT